MRSRTWAALLTLAVAAAATPARADEQQARTATAVALFNEARALMTQQRYLEACAKFSAANDLWETPGTWLNLGECNEQGGRLASAWAAFKRAANVARKAGDPPREEAAKQRADLLEPRLAKLQIDVFPDDRPAGLAIRQDGQDVPSAAWGTPVPIDAGEHVIEVSAPGKQTWKATVRIEATAGTTRAAVPPLVAAVPASPAAEAPRFWGPQRIAGASVGGVGVIGLVIGAAFGGRALSRMATSKETCRSADPVDRCDAAGLAARHDAKAAANVSTGMLSAGLVALAGGAVLFATARGAKPLAASSMPRVNAAATAGGATVTIEGVW
jgi:hypothetical protein